MTRSALRCRRLRIIELGDILVGKEKGRQSNNDITLFYHSGGQGVSDIPIAALLYEKAKQMGIGETLMNWTKN